MRLVIETLLLIPVLSVAPALMHAATTPAVREHAKMHATIDQPLPIGNDDDEGIYSSIRLTSYSVFGAAIGAYMYFSLWLRNNKDARSVIKANIVLGAMLTSVAISPAFLVYYLKHPRPEFITAGSFFGAMVAWTFVAICDKLFFWFINKKLGINLNGSGNQADTTQLGALPAAGKQ